MRVVAYVRVSSKEQDETIQVNAIGEFCKSHKYELINMFIDKGVSGALPPRERPGFSQMLEFMKNNPVDAIVVWSLDRLGRTMLESFNTLAELENGGIRVLSVKEEFLQTLDPTVRKLIVSVLLWVAEFERKRFRERVEEAWRQGKQKGRPRKVDDATILRYLAKYPDLRVKDIWRVMKGDGYSISYSRLAYWVRVLRKKQKGQQGR